MHGIRALACAAVVLFVTAPVSVKQPDQPGIYKVGFTKFVVTDASRDRSIPISVFYPVSPSDVDSSSAPAEYPRDPVNRPGETLSSTLFGPLGVDPAYEAPAPSSHAPFPLVVFSPGLNNHSSHYVYLGARLASHGYVVALLSHPGESSHTRVVMSNRVMDMSFALTELLVRNNTPGELLNGTMDPGMVVSAGHSIGGYAAIAATAGDDNVCNPVPANPPPPGSCVGVGADPRFAALVALDASNFLLSFEDMELVTVPSLGMGRDPATLQAQNSPYGAANQARQHAAFGGSPNYRVDVLDSRHASSFTNICEHTLVELAVGNITQATANARFVVFECSVPGVIAPAEGHRLVTAYVVSFLDKIADRLDDDNGETNSLRLLEPAWAARHEPGVRLFLTETDGPEAARRNLSAPATFQYFLVPPDYLGTIR